MMIVKDLQNMQTNGLIAARGKIKNILKTKFSI